MIIQLKESDFIGEGTARVTYRHPDDHSKCIKLVVKSKLEQKKRRRGIFSTFRSTSCFAPTKAEHRIFKKLIFKTGFEAFQHIPMFYGSVNTDQGSGDVFDFIGEINLEEHLKTKKFDPCLESKLLELRDFLLRLGIHFSDWRASNLVLKWNEEGTDYRIYAIDGFEHTELLPITRIPYFSRRKIRRRFDKFIKRLRKLSSNES